MGDVKKDVESMRRINASGSDKLEIMADITDFIISSFVDKIKKENPDISRDDLIKKLKVMLYYDRRILLEQKKLDKVYLEKRAKEEGVFNKLQELYKKAED